MNKNDLVFKIEKLSNFDWAADLIREYGPNSLFVTGWEKIPSGYGPMVDIEILCEFSDLDDLFFEEFAEGQLIYFGFLTEQELKEELTSRGYTVA